MPIHLDRHRIILVAGGERAGKSATAVNYSIPRLIDGDLFWIVGDDYKTPRAELNYFDEYLGDLGLIKRKSIPVNQFQPAYIETHTGQVIQTVTSHDAKKLASVAPDGIIMAEAARHSYESFLRLRGRIAEKRGWLFMCGTFESSLEWYADLWEEWQDESAEGRSYSLPTWTNHVIYPGGLDDPEIVALRGRYSQSRFDERFAGKPVPPATVVFPEFRVTKHTGNYPYDPTRPVEIAIDPGYAGAYAVLAIQWDNDRIYVIDEVYLQGQGVRDVIRECRSRPWFESIRSGVIDIAGKQHQGMESHVEIWASPLAQGGAAIGLRSRYIPIEDGIERLRTFLIHPVSNNPRIFYNTDTTRQSQREFKQYRYPEDREGRAIRERPIDRDNHSIKAITYWLVNRFGYTAARRNPHPNAVFGSRMRPNNDSTKPGIPEAWKRPKDQRRPAGRPTRSPVAKFRYGAVSSAKAAVRRPQR